MNHSKKVIYFLAFLPLFSLFVAVLFSGVLLFGFGTVRADVPGFTFDCTPNAYYLWDSSANGLANPLQIINSCTAPQGSCPSGEYLQCNGAGTGFNGVLVSCDKPSDGCPAPLSVSCSPKTSSLNVGDVRTFTGSASGGTPSYIYHWRSNVTCGEEWTCQSNGQIFGSENQCTISCSGSCIHTSGQEIQSCKLFFGAPGPYTPTIEVMDTAGRTAGPDSCTVTVTAPQTGSVFAFIKIDDVIQDSSGPDCAKQINGHFDGPGTYDKNFGGGNCASGTQGLPHFWPNSPIGVYTFSYDSGGPSGKTFDGIEGAATQTLSANGSITAYYKFKSASAPPQCFIEGQTNGTRNVQVGDHFNIGWSNSVISSGTLVSSGWSGLITCSGPDATDPDTCKAKYLKSGGLPACPPQSGTFCMWANGGNDKLFFQTSGTSTVTITATNQDQQATCSFSVTATAPLVTAKFRCSGGSSNTCIRDDAGGTTTDPNCNNTCVQPRPGPFSITSLTQSSCPLPLNNTIAWSQSSGATDYDLFFCTGSECTPSTNLLPGSNDTATGFTHGVTPLTTYRYLAIAKNSAGSTQSSNKGEITGTASCVSNPTLTVTKSGSGTGTVASNESPPKINCGSTCSASYTTGSNVTLTATPALGSTFAGWSGGGCSGTGSCAVTMDVSKTVNAIFDAITALQNNASCAGINAPSSVTAGKSFSAIVTMQNTGTKDWINPDPAHNNPYNLGSQNLQDNTRWGLNRVPLPLSPRKPGDQAIFSFFATAPASPASVGCTAIGDGSHTCPFDWKMVQDGVQWFGQTCTKTITVNPVGGGTGTVHVRATLKGAPWTGSFVIDSITPTGSFLNVTTFAPSDFPNNAAGTHKVVYKSGGPSGATFQSITPSDTQTLTAGGEITFTFNFASSSACPSGQCTISGRVFNQTTNAGFAGATITTCRVSPATVSTDGNGNFSFQVPQKEGYCARVSPETRSGFTGPTLNNNPGLESAKSYEHQVAGWNCATQGGCNSDQNIWDRSSDSGVVFKYTTGLAPLTASCFASPSPATTGQTVTWTGSASGGSGTGYTYSWSGAVSGTGNPKTASYASTGTQTANMTVTDSASNTTPASCSDTITSSGAPTLVVTPSSASIVVGATQQFTATFDPDGSGPLSPTNVTASASWSSSNTGIATVAAGLAKGVAPGSVTISATSNGLTRTATLTVSAVVVPIVVTANVTPLSGLPGSSFVFTGSATGGNGGPYTYSWDFGDSTTGAFASTTHSYAVPGTYVVQLTASDSSGSGKSSPIAIVVSNPPPSIKITANPVFISQGSATTIQWVITGAVSCTYTSSPPDAVWNAQTSATGGTFTVHPTQTTTYTITCTNGALSSTASVRIIVGIIQESNS